MATACSSPPEGRARWTLELLADAMVKLTEHEGLSRETVAPAPGRERPPSTLWAQAEWMVSQRTMTFTARLAGRCGCMGYA